MEPENKHGYKETRPMALFTANEIFLGGLWWMGWRGEIQWLLWIERSKFSKFFIFQVVTFSQPLVPDSWDGKEHFLRN